MSLSHTERAAGLTQPLPAAEQMLWQGKPEPRAFTRSVFRLRGLSIYFGVAACTVFAAALKSGRPIGQSLAEVTLLIPFALIAFGLLTLVGRASARATTYTLTNRRLILHIGVAYEMTVSIPLSTVVNAALRRQPGGFGEIALAVKDVGATGYVALWPHARAWHWFTPQPMLRGIADADALCETLAEALIQFNAGGRVARRTAPPSPVVFQPEVAAA